MTTWGERGQSLNDYANRSWAGLMNGYYTPRWEMFVREVIKSLREGIPFDEKKFDGLMKDFEYDWANMILYPRTGRVKTDVK
ncbi:MAG: alpha-N-acetylglucosaminidase C-terminal domain-containing protein [Odoribacter sp.]